jgi:DNA-directed RNA polymerase specialized sigma24 family protein
MTTATTTDIFFTSHETKPRTSQSQLEEFDEWFSRCRNTLEYTAFLILADSKMAESAVQNCWFKASRNPPGFKSEGAFRSWVLRRVISEALHILDQCQTEACGRRRTQGRSGRKGSTNGRFTLIR